MIIIIPQGGPYFCLKGKNNKYDYYNRRSLGWRVHGWVEHMGKWGTLPHKYQSTIGIIGVKRTYSVYGL